MGEEGHNGHNDFQKQNLSQVIGDMGEKIGLNGVDNGFMMFDRYRVPRDALLNATGGIGPDGSYVTPYKDPAKRFGASLGDALDFSRRG
jgi:hypothetical protein